jgi:glycosyltransferase involved in cell wall biosynthesis
VDEGTNTLAERSAGSPTRPLKVAVLIGLEWTPRSGGHVKSWERLAEAAVRGDGGVDLSVHVLGKRPGIVPLSSEVRFVVHRPVFSTARLPFLRGMPDHADLAPNHRGAMRALAGVDVIHTTDCHFAFAKTAVKAARRYGAGLVNSLHTDNVGYTRVFAEQLLQRWAGDGALGRWLVEGVKVPQRLEAGKRREFAVHLAQCDRLLASTNDDLGALEKLVGAHRPSAGARVSVLRRGIDTARFNPQQRDRGRLLRRLGIGEDHTVVLFVGRIDRSKNVATLAQAARLLLDRGERIHVAFAGEGSQRPEIEPLLAGHTTFLGALPQDDLAWLYASSDLFVFPSRLDVAPNVVVEAKASGLPVVVAPNGGDRFVRASGADGMIVNDEAPAAWAAAISALIADPVRRAAIGAAAAADIKQRFPSWDEVLEQDVLPVWRAVTGRR